MASDGFEHRTITNGMMQIIKLLKYIYILTTVNQLVVGSIPTAGANTTRGPWEITGPLVFSGPGPVIFSAAERLAFPRRNG